ncbi:hypothetical protein [Marinactinospora rubrisoli]|uniref:Uncharacterized protein n=1 Tax=Marinactinospora rubrisoli TaxID=2715399 RepID=A0ABW2KHQ0_9ACTN
MSSPDDERRVEMFDDDLDVLPDVTGDERGPGWGESAFDADEADRLLEDRPPHWA